jgi:pimeloyl-ACP methyl ester carboxylesterase
VPLASANGLELMYDEFGEGPPIILIMGIASQMLLWDESLCRRIAARGFRVIRFDNRDIGLSTMLHARGVPKLGPILGRALLGAKVDVPYTLSDMAADVAGLLEHLGLPSAHVVGASMGGMIAQHLALEHPGRVRSLTAIMSATGAVRPLLGVKPSTLRAFLRPRPRTPEEAVEFVVELYRELHGGRTPFPEDAVRARTRMVIERSLNPAAFPRQLAAIIASGDRTPRLASLTLPTLVLHGEADPLIPIAAGRALADAIPGARFLPIADMGHFLPPHLWPKLADEIAAHAASADATHASALPGG